MCRKDFALRPQFVLSLVFLANLASIFLGIIAHTNAPGLMVAGTSGILTVALTAGMIYIQPATAVHPSVLISHRHPSVVPRDNDHGSDGFNTDGAEYTNDENDDGQDDDLDSAKGFTIDDHNDNCNDADTSSLSGKVLNTPRGKLSGVVQSPEKSGSSWPWLTWPSGNKNDSNMENITPRGRYSVMFRRPGKSGSKWPSFRWPFGNNTNTTVSYPTASRGLGTAVLPIATGVVRI
jgi:hypothetical protein